jgi:hypothetical protein
MRLVEDYQHRPPKLTRQMNDRLQKQSHELPTLYELQLVEVNYCGHLILDEPTREQRAVAGIGRQLATRTNQQHVDGLAQAGKLALMVEHNGLDASAFGYETEQPRLATARIRLHKEPGVDQCRQVTSELPVIDNLSDDHRLALLNGRKYVDPRESLPANNNCIRELSLLLPWRTGSRGRQNR